jgi:hypothetical protein
MLAMKHGNRYAVLVYQPTTASTPIPLPRWVWVPARSGSLPGYWSPCAYIND